ncbi:hypothetical protein A9Q99_17665 [Gammaproteobacteria bacterium 45_16_T64]|nr:hypothetical protein A9Q99_17665 [Gammaproteobacteria bacterium 45_16_T64]
MSVLSDDKDEYLSESFVSLDLCYEEISDLEFEDCTFTECDWSDAVLSRCRFIECHFIKCNLSNANVAHSKFLDVVFEECKIIGLDWTKCDWPNLSLPSPIRFNRCIMNDSSFYGLSLSELVLDECKCHDADFREADVSEGNFSGTDLANSVFGRTNLSGVDFTEATHYTIDIYENNLKGAKFCRYEAVRLLEGLDIELVD